MGKRQPMQPIEMAEDGIIRFKPNAIVRRLVDHCKKTGFGLNEIYSLTCDNTFSYDDFDQLMQLIGYSVCGFGDVAFDRQKVYRADAKARKLAHEKRISGSDQES